MWKFHIGPFLTVKYGETLKNLCKHYIESREPLDSLDKFGYFILSVWIFYIVLSG